MSGPRHSPGRDLPRGLSPALLARAARSFGLDPADLTFVRDVANVVYAMGRGSRARFLRLSHRDDHTLDQVAAEIEWLRFLLGEGLPVCRPLPAKDGRWVVPVTSSWTAVLFARVRGRAVAARDFTTPCFEEMGRFLGRLHAATARFEPADPARRRPRWDEGDGRDRVLASWPARDDRIAETWRRVHRRITAAVEDAALTLVHADMHRGNLFLYRDRIQVIDFDDSCYFVRAADIANAIYYALWNRRYEPEPERAAFAAEFQRALLDGYASAHSLAGLELELVPDLLEYRDLSVDAFSHRRFGDDPDPETARRWRHVRARIARGDPYVALPDWPGAECRRP